MSDDKPRTYAQIMESCKRARERIERPDVRAEIAAWLRSDASRDLFESGDNPLSIQHWLADRIESWPLPAGTPDVAGALALLREADEGGLDFGQMVRVIAEARKLLEGKDNV